MNVRTYPSCPEYVAGLSLDDAREFLKQLEEERATYGSHPQLECDIEDAQKRIKEIEG